VSLTQEQVEAFVVPKLAAPVYSPAWKSRLRSHGQVQNLAEQSSESLTATGEGAEAGRLSREALRGLNPHRAASDSPRLRSICVFPSPLGCPLRIRDNFFGRTQIDAVTR
jgi:hypothetical protein